MIDTTEIMTVKELAKYLKVNRQTIYNWVHNHKITYTKIGGSLLRFRKSDIDEWMGWQKVKKEK